VNLKDLEEEMSTDFYDLGLSNRRSKDSRKTSKNEKYEDTGERRKDWEFGEEYTSLDLDKLFDLAEMVSENGPKSGNYSN